MLYPELKELFSYKDCRQPSCSVSPAVASMTSGGHGSLFRGQGLELDSVRDYVPGDDIRHIDWRVTARTGTAHLKLFKEERDRETVLCVDMNGSMRFGTKNTFKSVQAARAAAFLGWRGLAQHDNVSACLFGDVPQGELLFRPRRMKSAFCRVLKALTEPFPDRHEVAISQALQLVQRRAHAGAQVYVISDFMDMERQSSLSAVLPWLSKKCAVVFIAVNDIADRSIYPVGPLTFSCGVHRQALVDTHSLAGQKAYEYMWEQSRRVLRELVAQAQIPLIELTTQSDVRRDLAVGLKTVGRRRNGGCAVRAVT